MIYHRDWARGRGDFTEARRLEAELVSVEAVRISIVRVWWEFLLDCGIGCGWAQTIPRSIAIRFVIHHGLFFLSSRHGFAGAGRNRRQAGQDGRGRGQAPMTEKR